MLGRIVKYTNNSNWTKLVSSHPITMVVPHPNWSVSWFPSFTVVLVGLAQLSVAVSTGSRLQGDQRKEVNFPNHKKKPKKSTEQKEK